jgi:hypothetical protein
MLTMGADSVEVIVQWYFANVTDTQTYAITDYASPLRTSTDDEIASIISYAHSKVSARTITIAGLSTDVSNARQGMKTLLTPMLDPDWALPAQNWCRDHGETVGCFWRGQDGYEYITSLCPQA